MQLDPDIAQTLTMLGALGFPAIGSVPPAQLRAAFEGLAAAGPAGPEMARVEDHEADGVPVRLYVPHGSLRAVINFMHGGGWTTGSISQADALARTLAARLSCAVVSVDYRHAPEHPFPAAVDDALCAARWTAAQSAALIGSDLPLILMGDSAGANLAAVASISARDAGYPAIKGQILMCPSAAGDAVYKQASDFQPPFLSVDQIDWFFDQYVPAPEDRRDPRFAPLFAASLAGLPPAFVLMAEYDLLRHDGEAYADALEKAGVEVVQRCYPGTVHSFVSFNPGFMRSREALGDIDSFIAGCAQ